MGRGIRERVEKERGWLGAVITQNQKPKTFHYSQHKYTNYKVQLMAYSKVQVEAYRW